MTAGHQFLKPRGVVRVNHIGMHVTQKGGKKKTYDHARGLAVDIGSFVMAARTITLYDHWRMSRSSTNSGQGIGGVVTPTQEELTHIRDTPAELFLRRRPVRLGRRGANTLLSIDLPTASGEEIDVSVLGDELHVGVRSVRRRIALPTSLVGLTVASAKRLEGVLEIELSGSGV